jgi:hypothetical protein
MRSRATVVMLAVALLVALASGTLAAPQTSDAGVPAPDAVRDPGGGGPLMGTLRFQIGHACQFFNLPRPWLLGEARHWDPQGGFHSRTFWHQSGYEWADFGWQIAGTSHGDARIIVGVFPCDRCSTGLLTYTVHPNMENTIPMVMVHW